MAKAVMIGILVMFAFLAAAMVAGWRMLPPDEHEEDWWRR